MSYSRKLAELVYIVNCDPPSLQREAFYQLKQKLLYDYAQPGDRVYQQIDHECWGVPGGHCDARCFKCGGSGIYSTTIIALMSWRWHGRQFLIPVGYMDRKPETIHIMGHVEHENHGDELPRIAWIQLLLLTGNFRLLIKEFCQGYEHYRGRSWLLRFQRTTGRLYRKLRACKQRMHSRLQRMKKTVWKDDVPF